MRTDTPIGKGRNGSRWMMGALAILASGVMGVGSAWSEQHETSKPNILFIITDDTYGDD